jgi:hypothetical protein
VNVLFDQNHGARAALAFGAALFTAGQPEVADMIE